MESMFFGWHKDASEIFIRLVNALVLTKDENELRTAVRKFAQDVTFNDIFAYGFGAHHFWVAQRMVTEPEKVMENRLLIVEF